VRGTPNPSRGAIATLEEAKFAKGKLCVRGERGKGPRGRKQRKNVGGEKKVSQLRPASRERKKKHTQGSGDAIVEEEKVVGGRGAALEWKESVSRAFGVKKILQTSARYRRGKARRRAGRGEAM